MTTRPKVLISDKMDPNAARILTERGCDVDVITGSKTVMGYVMKPLVRIRQTALRER